MIKEKLNGLLIIIFIIPLQTEKKFIPDTYTTKSNSLFKLSLALSITLSIPDPYLISVVDVKIIIFIFQYSYVKRLKLYPLFVIKKTIIKNPTLMNSTKMKFL